MIFHRLSFFLFLTALFFTAGCNTLDSRIREKQTAFQSLDASAQERLRAGRVSIGDTEDMVYIALGKPSSKQELTSESGNSIVWIYTSSWQEFRGMAFVGYDRELVPDGKGGTRTVYLTEERPVYVQHTEERCRITFVDGKVTQIEQAHPTSQLMNAAK